MCLSLLIALYLADHLTTLKIYEHSLLWEIHNLCAVSNVAGVSPGVIPDRYFQIITTLSLFEVGLFRKKPNYPRLPAKKKL